MAKLSAEIDPKFQISLLIKKFIKIDTELFAPGGIKRGERINEIRISLPDVKIFWFDSDFKIDWENSDKAAYKTPIKSFIEAIAMRKEESNAEKGGAPNPKEQMIFSTLRWFGDKDYIDSILRQERDPHPVSLGTGKSGWLAWRYVDDPKDNKKFFGGFLMIIEEDTLKNDFGLQCYFERFGGI
ncbi:hypothetical protein HYY75_01005, partial [bacterium]|nr:hypothetical protein [bacterium]